MSASVLVTGASSGIGRNITERLASNGHFVYAIARKAEDLESLNTIDNVQAIRLDVTSGDDIAAAVDAVSAEGRPTTTEMSRRTIYTTWVTSIWLRE